MINKLNIDIYNYIFSINVNIQNRVNTCSKEKNIKELIALIESNYNINDFWKENKDMFNDGCLRGHQYIMEKEYTYDIESFPRLKLNSKLEFLNFKIDEIKKIIENNGIIEKKQLDVIFKNIEDLGRKEILEYCKEENIVDYNEEKTFIKGGQTGLAMILYDNIKPVIYGNNYNTVQQNNNLDSQDDNIPIINKQEFNAENIIILSDKAKMNKNDFSKNKKEIEKETILDKIVNFITSIFKRS